MMRHPVACGAVLLLLVTGCGAGPQAPVSPTNGATVPRTAGEAFDRTKPWPGPSTPYRAVPMSEQEIEAFMEARRKESAEAFHLDDPPKVEVVRFGTHEEASRDSRQCYIDAGFDVEDQGGGAWFPKGGINPEVDKAEALAYYTCQMKFPMHPKYAHPLTAEQLGVLYEYTRDWLIPCVRSLGYEPDGHLPSRDVYIQQVMDKQEGDFFPYPQLGNEEAQRIRQECPAWPPVLQQ